MAEYRTVEALCEIGRLQQYLRGVREHDARVRARHEKPRAARARSARRAPRVRVNLLASAARRAVTAPSPEVQVALVAALEASAKAVAQAPRVDLFALLTRTRAA